MDGVTIDAGHLPLRQRRMRAFWSSDRTHFMTLAACDAVIAPHDIARDVRKLDPARIPDRSIAEIAGLFRDHVLDAGDQMRIGLDEPIVGRDMAVAASRHHTDIVRPVPRFLKLRVRGDRRHRMAGHAKGIARSSAINLGAGDDATRADQHPQRNEGKDCDPSPLARRYPAIWHWQTALADLIDGLSA